MMFRELLTAFSRSGEHWRAAMAACRNRRVDGEAKGRQLK